jgi:hypothetical protein
MNIRIRSTDWYRVSLLTQFRHWAQKQLVMIDRGTFQDFLDRYFSDQIKDFWTFLNIFTGGSLLGSSKQYLHKNTALSAVEILSCRWMRGCYTEGCIVNQRYYSLD